VPAGVVGRDDGARAVLPAHDLPLRRRLDPRDVLPPRGVAAREVDEDAVEAVPLAQAEERLGEAVGGEPDVERPEAGPEEVVAERELAHRGDAVGDALPHRDGHAFPGRHGKPPPRGFGEATS
jgi:hypothetical protein